MKVIMVSRIERAGEHRVSAVRLNKLDIWATQHRPLNSHTKCKRFTHLGSFSTAFLREILYLRHKFTCRFRKIAPRSVY